jgi:hypothetical protein
VPSRGRLVARDNGRLGPRQGRCCDSVRQELAQESLAGLEEALGQADRFGVLVFHLVDPVIIKRVDRGIWIGQDDGRVGRDDEL